MGMYFANRLVEWQLTLYHWTGCSDLAQRDAVMTHSGELCTQMIRKLRLAIDDSAMADLKSISWIQIEKTLYKYRAQPYCRACFREDQYHSKPLIRLGEFDYKPHTPEEVVGLVRRCRTCKTHLEAGPLRDATVDEYGGTSTILYKGKGKLFNMWSQVARTVCFAHLKKCNREQTYRVGLTRRASKAIEENQRADALNGSFAAMREFFRYDDRALLVIDAAVKLVAKGKLVRNTSLSAVSGVPIDDVRRYLKLFRVLRFEFEPERVTGEDWGRRDFKIPAE